ncbi:hypothetical protein BGZ81_001644 [Podila clonocystis]|nr:hypothetical protein BGZ81_001644 [Podila clonocystis]
MAQLSGPSVDPPPSEESRSRDDSISSISPSSDLDLTHSQEQEFHIPLSHPSSISAGASATPGAERAATRSLQETSDNRPKTAVPSSGRKTWAQHLAPRETKDPLNLKAPTVLYKTTHYRGQAAVLPLEDMPFTKQEAIAAALLLQPDQLDDGDHDVLMLCFEDATRFETVVHQPIMIGGVPYTMSPALFDNGLQVLIRAERLPFATLLDKKAALTTLFEPYGKIEHIFPDYFKDTVVMANSLNFTLILHGIRPRSEVYLPRVAAVLEPVSSPILGPLIPIVPIKPPLNNPTTPRAPARGAVDWSASKPLSLPSASSSKNISMSTSSTKPVSDWTMQKSKSSSLQRKVQGENGSTIVSTNKFDLLSSLSSVSSGKGQGKGKGKAIESVQAPSPAPSSSLSTFVTPPPNNPMVTPLTPVTPKNPIVIEDNTQITQKKMNNPTDHGSEEGSSPTQYYLSQSPIISTQELEARDTGSFPFPPNQTADLLGLDFSPPSPSPLSPSFPSIDLDLLSGVFTTDGMQKESGGLKDERVLSTQTEEETHVRNGEGEGKENGGSVDAGDHNNKDKDTTTGGKGSEVDGADRDVSDEEMVSEFEDDSDTEMAEPPLPDESTMSAEELLQATAAHDKWKANQLQKRKNKNGKKPRKAKGPTGGISKTKTLQGLTTSASSSKKNRTRTSKRAGKSVNKE